MKRILHKKVAWLLALVLIISNLIPQTTLATATTNENQIEQTADKYNYYDLQSDGSEGKATTVAENTYSEARKGTVTTAKTIEATAIENEFIINLQVTATENFNDLELSEDAAVVLVLDRSGSMQWDLDGKGRCTVEGCEHEGQYVSSGTDLWWHLWGEPSRFELMCNSLIGTSSSTGFLDSFVKDSGNAQRKVSVVTFGGENEDTTVLGWTDVNTKSGMNTVKEEVSFENLTSKVRSQTSPGHGLAEAVKLLAEDSSVKDIPNRYVILLTDGRPEGTSSINDGSHTESQAAIVKENCNATLYSIGFGTKNITMLTSEKKPVNEWLENNVSSKGCFIAAQSGDELDLGLQNISQTIKTIANAWHVTDPMGKNIVFEGFTDSTTAATFSDNTINWDLNKETATLSNGEYVYNLQYKVRLDNTKSDFAVDKFYLANGYTDLSYFFIEEVVENGKVIVSNSSAVRHLNFKVPAVQGYLGDLYLCKIANHTGNALADASFELIHAGDNCSVCNGKVEIEDFTSTSNEKGELYFANVPSGHEFILKETKAPTGYELSNKTYTIEIAYGKVYVDGVESTQEIPVEITNEPIVTTISGEKTWNDSDDQDGIRPEKIVVNLLADGEIIVTKEVTPDVDGNWKYSFKDVLVYNEKGSIIQYTVSEEKVEGYEAITSENGCDITNTHIPETIEISGNKTWDDADNQDGVRPESITINLYADDEKIDSKVVTADDNWTWSFTDLPKYRDHGTEIVYTITEEAVEGYETTVNGYDVTNSYTPATTSVEGSKTWNDNNDQDGIRPAAITVNLLADGEVVDSATASEATDWTWSFKDLPKYRDHGTEIIYTIEEVTVEGYETEVNGYDLTNTHTPATTSVEGNKTWNDTDNQDGLRPESITINLLADGEVVDSKTVTADDDWAWSFKDLPKYRDHGTEIVYTITEDKVPGYAADVDGYDVTNTHTPAVVSVEGTKTWDDANNQDGVRPESIIISLLADGKVIETKEVTASDNWAWSFTDLPKYRDQGVEIIYTIEEDTVAGYETVINGYNVTNTHEPEKTSISGVKTWIDNDNQDGKRPESITVNLLANGEVVASKEVTASDNWAWTFDNLDKYEAGEEIIYTVEEEITEGYNPAYDGFDITNTYDPEKINIIGHKIWNDDFDRDGIRPDSVTVYLYADGKLIDKQTVTALQAWTWSFTGLDRYRDGGVPIIYTITEKPVKGYATAIVGHNVVNTHIPETVNLEGSKTWNDNNDQDGLRPENIVINLYADGVKIKSVVVSEEDGWNWEFKHLPKYRHHGIEIDYTITENPVDGYTTTVDGLDVTNTHVPEVTSVSGTKTWDDADNQDGIRPESIVIYLLADGEIIATKEVTEADNWTWTFDNLPKYKDQGVEIIYTIQEEAVEGYETVMDGFHVTNTHVPEVTSVSGSKTWDDADDKDGLRPESITIYLLANGEVIDTKEVTEDDDWTWTFDNLPKYEAGTEIAYEIDEEAVEGYETTVDGYDVTNTHIPEDEPEDPVIPDEDPEEPEDEPENDPEKPAAPDTGDHSNIGFNFIMMCLAACTIKFVLEFKRAARRRR